MIERRPMIERRHSGMAEHSISITPLLESWSAAHRSSAAREFSRSASTPLVDPVRLISLSGALDERKRLSDGGVAESALPPVPSAADTFVAQDVFDHPWRGLCETWYDYLAVDLPYWRRVVLVHLPLQFLGASAATVGIGLLLASDPAAPHQAGALSAPVSAFSLLVSLLLTFRHSVAYARFWDGKGYTTSLLASARYVAFAFVDAPLEHRRQAAAMVAALVDSYARSLQGADPTEASIFEHSPPGPWRACARAALPARLRERLQATPGCLVATVVGELCVCAPTAALEPVLRGMVLAELASAAKAGASALAMSLMPVPPIYTWLLQAMIFSFTASLALLTALSLSQWQSPLAWALSASTVGLIHGVLYTFYKAAMELAKPFRGKLQVPLRMYEAALLHDVYVTLKPLGGAVIPASQSATW